MYSELAIDDENANHLPKPKGYKILVAIPKVQETSKGGVFLPDKLKDAEQTATVVGYVIQLGPEAYVSENKFPSGAWCKKGDYVVFRSYSGTRIKVGEQEYRLIDDDSVEAVVADPRKIMRAY